MFAVLGDITFETLTSPEAFRSTSDYHFAEHKIVEAAPRLQWLANELQKISLDLRFHVAYTNPATQMNRLRAAAEDHQARALVFGNGVHRGYFVIETLEETHEQLADDGSYIAIAVRLELQEWIPGADFDPTAPARPTNLPPGIVQSSPSTSTSLPSALSAPVSNATTYNPNQPISPHNLLPTNAIVQLTNAGAGPGVTYTEIPYNQPGVSSLTGPGPATATPGDPTTVATTTIVRAG